MIGPVSVCGVCVSDNLRAYHFRLAVPANQFRQNHQMTRTSQAGQINEHDTHVINIFIAKNIHRLFPLSIRWYVIHRDT